MMHRILLSRGLPSLSLGYARNVATKWDMVPPGPPDAILGITQAFLKCQDPKKQNLGVGAYRDDNGKPFKLSSVREAEKRVLDADYNHEYLPIHGLQSFVDEAVKVIYGEDSEVLKSKKLAAVQVLSGTGGLRVMGEFLKRFYPNEPAIYLPSPTWGNHIPIFKDSGLSVRHYSYYDPKTRGLCFDEMMNDIHNAPESSVFLFHACAHNPTGVDPNKEQWDEISKACEAKEHFVFFDSAYQGFASGDFDRDAYAIRKFIQDGHRVAVCQSFAKNMGLYGQRAGTLSLVCDSEDERSRIESQLKIVIRPMYSNPPLHGARLANEILSDPELKTLWKQEVTQMATRIIDMRSSLRTNLESLGSAHNWNHITDQIGMFCYTGLTQDQVERLTSEYHIYMTKDGRISMAGVTSQGVKYLAEAIHAVTK